MKHLTVLFLAFLGLAVVLTYFLKNTSPVETSAVSSTAGVLVMSML